MRLKDKVAIVTGAAQGIGHACAEALLREGAKVVLSDVNDGAAAAAKLGAAASFVRCDVGDSAQVNALVEAAVARHGRLDIMVSNAGISLSGDFLTLKEEDWDRVMRVNLKGVFLTGQAAARQMVKQGKPAKGSYAIINMSSVNAVLAIPSIPAYVAAKGGVNQLTKVMALSLVDHGIRVNAIGPGTIATDLAKASVLSSDEARRRVMSRTPMKRLGEPSEIGSVVVFLASDESSYITGTTIYPDGGRLGLNYTVAVD
ncbi:MAG: SDR family oxidoreductase [Alphaproteobacteria bacterium]|nr:SDR family oxidoreductase [Alphaproteobacteria bacterium]